LHAGSIIVQHHQCIKRDRGYPHRLYPNFRLPVYTALYLESHGYPHGLFSGHEPTYPRVIILLLILEYSMMVIHGDILRLV